jgi:hypothetical protein
VPLIVFLLLGVVWAAVLVPPWLQSRRDARPIASMMSFRSQLWSLERATPTYGDSYGAEGEYGDGYGGGYAEGGHGSYEAAYTTSLAYTDSEQADAVTGGADVHPFRPSRRVASAGAAGSAALAPGVVGAVVRSASGSVSPAPSVRTVAAAQRRARTYRRRRQVLGVLAILTAAGVAPALLLAGPWVVAEAVAATLLVAYVGLLVRRGRREVERVQKVRYLTPIRAPRPAVVVFGSGAAR